MSTLRTLFRDLDAKSGDGKQQMWSLEPSGGMRELLNESAYPAMVGPSFLDDSTSRGGPHVDKVVS